MKANNTAKSITVRADPDEINTWKLAARRDRRSLAGWIRQILGIAAEKVKKQPPDLTAGEF